MLDTIMKVCGCFFTIAVTAALFTCIRVWLENRLELRKEKLEAKALKEANIIIGRRLVSDSYWLKEKEAMAMRSIGNSMVQFGTYDIVRIREELDNESI